MIHHDSEELKILIANLKRFIETELVPLERESKIGDEDEVTEEARRRIRLLGAAGRSRG